MPAYVISDMMSGIQAKTKRYIRAKANACILEPSTYILIAARCAHNNATANYLQPDTVPTYRHVY